MYIVALLYKFGGSITSLLLPVLCTRQGDEIMIQLIDVTKAFKNNVVLDGISMDFRDGELTVLIGPS